MVRLLTKNGDRAGKRRGRSRRQMQDAGAEGRNKRKEAGSRSRKQEQDAGAEGRAAKLSLQLH